METVQLNVQVLAAALALWIPLITGIVTKKVAHPGVKAIVNALLSALAGGVAVAIAAKGKVVPADWAYSMFAAWATSISSYYGWWKPSTIAPKLADKTANVGLG